MATTCLALLLAGLALVAYDSYSFKQQQKSELIAQADMIGAISSAALVFDDGKAANEYLATLKVRPRVRLATLYRPDGRVFAAFQRDVSPSSTLPSMESEGSRVEGDDLLVFRKVWQGSELLGTVHLRANLNLRTRVLSYTGLVLLLSLVALGLALLLSGRFQALIAQPLLEVAEVAKGVVERQDYSPRVTPRTDDEVGVLVVAFNEMLNQIQQREAELQEANIALQAEIREHRVARDEVAALNQSLERRVAERTAELETLNKELESFSYSVSHDLRAPLRSIDGFTAILQKNLADQLDEQGKGYMTRVRAATQRMGHLIDDLLSLSRTARSGMVRREIDLSHLAESILHDLQEGAPERIVKTTVASGMVVHADTELMRAVLENLLGNAWKFTAKKADARIDVGVKQEAGDTVYFVQDNGAGFDMKYVEKLFGAFQRLHATTDFEGTGVGLANVQRIIHRHGGKVWCEGEVDRGATFYFTIPN